NSGGAPYTASHMPLRDASHLMSARARRRSACYLSPDIPFRLRGNGADTSILTANGSHGPFPLVLNLEGSLRVVSNHKHSRFREEHPGVGSDTWLRAVRCRTCCLEPPG